MIKVQLEGQLKRTERQQESKTFGRIVVNGEYSREQILRVEVRLERNSLSD